MFAFILYKAGHISKILYDFQNMHDSFLYRYGLRFSLFLFP